MLTEEQELRNFKYQEALNINIQALMDKHKVRKYAIHKATGITQVSLAMNLKNEGNWLAWQIMAIADYFNVTLNDLSKRPEDEPKDPVSQIKSLQNKVNDLEYERQQLQEKLDFINKHSTKLGTNE